MKPDYSLAAGKAAETLRRFGSSDPLTVLGKFENVHLIAIGAEDQGMSAAPCAFDALTVTGRREGKEKQIVIYNRDTSPVRLRFALARELGRIILEHGEPDEAKDEEAGCFAHYFLCPLTMPSKGVKIRFRPKHYSRLWEMKSIIDFDSMENLKIFVAEEGNKFNRFIGKKTNLKPEDVQLSGREQDLSGWKNCYAVILNGKTVGYCGE